VRDGTQKGRSSRTFLMRCLGALLGMALVAAACGSGGVESRLAGDSDEDDHERTP